MNEPEKNAPSTQEACSLHEVGSRTTEDSVRREWESASPGFCDMCGQPGDLEPGVIVHGAAVGYVCSKCCPRTKSAWDSWRWASSASDGDRSSATDKTDLTR